MSSAGSNASVVSVIVPGYCHEDFILDCLLSIHDQTYANIELVLIDDCSTDATFEQSKALLATSFGRRFVNVVLERNPQNIGAYATISKGVAASRGDYITVINSDDLFRPQRISRILQAMQEAGSELGFSLVNVIGTSEGDRGKPEFPDQFLLYPLQLAFKIQRDPTVGFGMLRENIAVSTGNLMFSRALYDKVGTFIPLKYCHDWDFVLQALFYTEPVPVLEPLYDYRLHGHNSFSSLANRTGMETEVALRRLFRRGLVGTSVNPLFPSPQNWPGFFETFVDSIGQSHLLDREKGLGSQGWRIYDAAGHGKR
jgi:glycosyltransferase involved in cell wall biosynthesis